MVEGDVPVEETTSKSMVIVTEENGGTQNDDSDYCSGFIAFSGATRGTYVVTQSGFVKGREDRLKICFFDKTELRASVIHGEPFGLLRTEFHPQCKKVKLMKGNITPSPAIIYPPSSPTSFYHLPCFVSVESVESYPVNVKKKRKGNVVISSDQVLGSNKSILVDCHYSENTSNGHERLETAPVYAMNGSVMGMVMQICDDEATMKKLVMCADSVSTLIDRLMPPASKRKRGGDGSCSNVKKSPVNKKKGDETSGSSKRVGNKRKRGGDGSCSNVKKSAVNKEIRDQTSSSSKKVGNKRKRGGDGSCSNVKKSSVNKKKRDESSGGPKKVGNKRKKGGDKANSKELAGYKMGLAGDNRFKGKRGDRFFGILQWLESN